MIKRIKNYFSLKLKHKRILRELQLRDQKMQSELMDYALANTKLLLAIESYKKIVSAISLANDFSKSRNQRLWEECEKLKSMKDIAEMIKAVEQ